MKARDRFEPSSGPGIGISIGLTIAALSALSIAFVPAHAEVAPSELVANGTETPVDAAELPANAETCGR